MLLFTLLFYIHASFSFIYSSIFFSALCFPAVFKIVFFFSDILCNSFFLQFILSIFFYIPLIIYYFFFNFYVFHSFFIFRHLFFFRYSFNILGSSLTIFILVLLQWFLLFFFFCPCSFLSFSTILCNILLLIIFHSCFAFPNAN